MFNSAINAIKSGPAGTFRIFNNQSKRGPTHLFGNTFRRFFNLSNSNMSVLVKPKGKHIGTLIFMHGLGDTGHGWADAFAEMKLQNIKCVFPNATNLPVTLNGGMSMPAWFDILTLSGNGPEDADGIKRASERIKGLIEEELKAGILAENIILGGFSQGGALAYYTALKYDKPLGGILALSCWLPLSSEFNNNTPLNAKIPMLQCHGDCDNIVVLRWAEMTRDFFKNVLKNEKHQFKVYRGVSHGSSPEEMAHVKQFMEGLIPKQ